VSFARLKQHALYHAVRTRNRLRRLEWDLLTPGELERRVLASSLLWQKSYPFAGARGRTGEPAIDAAIDAESGRQQLAYVTRCSGDFVVEPRYGYVVEKPLGLIDLSMPYAEWSRDPGRDHLIGFPSPANVALGLVGKGRIVREDRVISLRFLWEDNYFHFLNDILPRLKMADDAGISRDVPVVIGERLARQAFFQTSFSDGTMNGRRIIVQDRSTFVAAKEVVLIRPLSLTRDNLVYVADLLGAAPEPEGNRRLFLTRSKSRGRYVANLPDLVPVLARFGVEVVDADGLTLGQQVELFGSAEVVVGIHGAGLGNLIFRRNAECALIEIFPPEEISLWFPWLAYQLGFTYTALSGYSDEPVVQRMQPFKVDPQRLAAKLEQVVSQAAQRELAVIAG
jgi:hypothetical protein